MELLIQLIVWIFQALFGEPEKPANMGSGKSRPSGQRGPMNHGDGRAKSLEEILEEVKREAERKRTEMQGGGRPRQNVPPPEPEPVKPRVSLRDQIDAAERKTAKTTAAAEAARPSGAFTPLSEVSQPTISTIAAPREMSSIVAIEAPAEAQSQAMHSGKPGKKKRGQQQRHPVAAQVATSAPAVTDPILFIRMLQSAPRPQRAAVARQALVVREVFGPPRAKLPYKRGI